jgi:hypothetical protein
MFMRCLWWVERSAMLTKVLGIELDVFLTASTEEEVSRLLPVALAGLGSPQSTDFALAIIHGVLHSEQDGAYGIVHHSR